MRPPAEPTQPENTIEVPAPSPEPADESPGRDETESGPDTAPPTTEVAPAPEIQDSGTATGTVVPKMTAASSTLNTNATPADPLQLVFDSLMAWVARQISHTFFNRHRSPGPIVYEQKSCSARSTSISTPPNTTPT
jgi:hypothetical protein